MIQDLINSPNGSWSNTKNIEIWNELPDEIKSKLVSPIKNSLEILELSTLISEQLETHQQIFLVNLVQIIWWRKTNNINIIKKLEKLKFHLKNSTQTKLAWEITFLKISTEDI